MEKDVLGAGIIYRQNKEQIEFVLIQDRFNKWTFPKGKSLAGENPEATALRESSEETGLQKLEIKKYLANIKYTADKRNKNVYFFLIESLDRRKKLVVDAKERIKQAIWAKSTDVIKLLGYENFVPCFKKALKHLNISF